MSDLKIVGGNANERRAHYQEVRPVEDTVSHAEEITGRGNYAPAPKPNRKSYSEVESRAVAMTAEYQRTITRYRKNDARKLLEFFATSKPHNGLDLNEKSRLSGLLQAAMYTDRVIIFDSSGNREIIFSPVLNEFNAGMTNQPPEVPFLTAQEQKQFMISQLFARLSLENFTVLQLIVEFEYLAKRTVEPGKIAITEAEVREALKIRLKAVEAQLQL